MKKSDYLSSRLQDVLLDGHWIANTNYQKQLRSVTMEQATHKIGDLNTIAALTYHINYYLAGLLNVFKGGALEIRDKYSFDLPPLETEADWQQLIETFVDNAQEFVRMVKAMSEAQIEGPFVDPKYGTYERNIEGVIEHSYYHLGQISLLRKLIG